MTPPRDPAAAGDAPVRMLYCRCAFAQVVPPEVKGAVLDGLAVSGSGFEAVADLCDMAARRDPHLADLAALSKDGATLRIAACWPRAVRGLFHLADAPLPETGVEILNMRTLPADRVLDGMLRGDAAAIAASAAARDDAAAEQAAAGRIAALGNLPVGTPQTGPSQTAPSQPPGDRP